MELDIQERHGVRVAVLRGEGILLGTTADALDAMVDAFQAGATALVVRADQLPPAFFDLSTRMAGEMLQKFTNYQIRFAVVGNFTAVESRSLAAFILESNRGRQTFFLPSEDEAVERLARCGCEPTRDFR
jgi:hypothetical protein